MNKEQQTSFFSKALVINVAFSVFVLLVIAIRLSMFLNINQFIDSDQPFMWIGAIDYSQGHFYEPRFYGQDYNSFLEPLFSVPLLWLGVPVYIALPIATHSISLFPFLFSAFYLFFNDKKENALLVLAIVLCMTPAYDVINSLPRGFVTGLIFGSFLVINYLQPNNMKWFIVNALLLLIGYFINPNSIILTAPFFAFMSIHNYKNPAFIFRILFVSLAVVPLYFIFDHFYQIHPNYVVYGIQHDFSYNYFIENISNPNQAFAHLNFFVEKNYYFLLLAIILLAAALYKFQQKSFIAFAGFLAVLLLSFFSGKTREGSFWPFYSYSRMYLAIPLVMVHFSSILHFSRRNLILIIVPICFLFSGYKILSVKENVAYHTLEKHAVGVHLVKLESVLEAIDFYKNICIKHSANHLLISNTFWLNTYLAYGGPAVDKDFPETEETRSERRYLVREQNKKKIFRNFVLISANSDFDKRTHYQKKFNCERLDDFGLFLIKNNTLTNEEFIALVNLIES